jgi:hypothetical protein
MDQNKFQGFCWYYLGTEVENLTGCEDGVKTASFLRKGVRRYETNGGWVYDSLCERKKLRFIY